MGTRTPTPEIDRMEWRSPVNDCSDCDSSESTENYYCSEDVRQSLEKDVELICRHCDVDENVLYELLEQNVDKVNRIKIVLGILNLNNFEDVILAQKNLKRAGLVMDDEGAAKRTKQSEELPVDNEQCGFRTRIHSSTRILKPEEYIVHGQTPSIPINSPIVVHSDSSNEVVVYPSCKEQLTLKQRIFFDMVVEMFPDVHEFFLVQEISNLDMSEESQLRFVTTVMLSGSYIKKDPETTSNVKTDVGAENVQKTDDVDSSVLQDGLPDSQIVEIAEVLVHVTDRDVASSQSTVDYENSLKDVLSESVNSTNLDQAVDLSTTNKTDLEQQTCSILNIPQSQTMHDKPSTCQQMTNNTNKTDQHLDSISSCIESVVKNVSGSDKVLAGSSPIAKPPTNSVQVPGPSRIIFKNLIKPVVRNATAAALVAKPSHPSTVVVSDNQKPGPSFGGITPAALIKDKPDEWIIRQTDNLIELFPKTDPSYLKNEVIKMNKDLDKLNNFVASKLEHNDMPTREVYEKQVKQISLETKYTTDFNIEDFLKAVPDPWAYFNDDTKRDVAKYKQHSLCYLKLQFKKHYVKLINNTFRDNQYNLYKSYHALKGERADRASNRSMYESQQGKPATIDIQFLQEVAFIENEDKIRKYIDSIKENKKQNLEEAKKAGTLMECLCCGDNEVLLEDVIYCPKDHTFCKDCVTRSTEIAIGDGKTVFECLENCDQEFPLAVLQTILQPRTFSKLIQAKQAEEVKAAGIEDLVQCPFCNFATILPPDDRIFKCLNPECMKESCRLCQELSHIPLKCDEVEKSDEVRMRTYIENKMTEALVRTCYKCKKKFVKEDGCNKMCCTCGAKMCYICQNPVQDYSHFNGQGGTETNKCPLYSTNNLLHVDLIKEVAKAAKEEILQKNPDKVLKIDPTLVLPELNKNERPLPGMLQIPAAVLNRYGVPALPQPAQLVPPVNFGLGIRPHGGLDPRLEAIQRAANRQAFNIDFLLNLNNGRRN